MKATKNDIKGANDTANVSIIPEGSIEERYRTLDSSRQAKLSRARQCAAMTLPEVLPPQGWTEQNQLPMPYSSTAGRGVSALGSRMLSALLPLNDMPFFSLGLKDGTDPSADADGYLESLSYQIYRKLSAKNLRETVYQILQHLIVVGDCLLVIEDDMSYRTIRSDMYTVRRNVQGDVTEIIYIEYVANPATKPAGEDTYTGTNSHEKRKGYEAVYVRCVWDSKRDLWLCQKERNGEIFETGEYTVLPYAPLRWQGVTGENYGRSHVETMMGDIQTLESYTQALIEGMAAGSSFWMGVDPSGITELDDLAEAENGQWVPARAQDIFTLSPSTTMKPQLDATMKGVEMMRSEVGKGFLLNSAAMPTGDRVTATAIRAVGQELEQVLGGAFSAIARDMMVPIVKRAMFLMIDMGDIDERLAKEFTSEGVLSVDIVTGLQALSRENDLTKLLQMGEMVRNLPEQAAANFRWDAYAGSLIQALGFDSRNWVKSEEEVAEEQQQKQMQELAAQSAQQVGGAVANAAGAAAQQDIQATGGQGIAAAAEAMNVKPMSM